MVSPPAVDVARFERLATSAANGDQPAFNQLIEGLWEWLLTFVRSNRSMGSLASQEDHVQEVAQGVLFKLAADGFRRLQSYTAWRDLNQGKTLLDWLRIVTKNAIRTYVAEQAGKPSSDSPSAVRLLNEFAQSEWQGPGVRPPFTDQQTARQLVEFAAQHLSAEQQQVLGLWLAQSSFEEIAQQLGISSSQAHRIYQEVVRRLRSHFKASAAQPSRF